jgi:hypothetical protein
MCVKNVMSIIRQIEPTDNVIPFGFHSVSFKSSSRLESKKFYSKNLASFENRRYKALVLFSHIALVKTVVVSTSNKLLLPMLQIQGSYQPLSLQTWFFGLI